METFSALLALCAGNSPVTGEFPSQRPVTQSFDVSLICVLNKRLSKQSRGWWLETPSRSLWRQCNALLDPYLKKCGWGASILGVSTLWRRHRATKNLVNIQHDDVIKWKHFLLYWPFVRGIRRSPVNSPHKGQWRGALMFSLICARING